MHAHSAHGDMTPSARASGGHAEIVFTFTAHTASTVDIDKPQRLRGLDEDAYVRGGRIATCDHLLRKTSRVLPASPHLLRKTSRVPSPRRRALTTRG